MSGGGGQNSTVTTQVEKLPAELVPFYKDMLGRGVYESLTGYETYPSRRLADFDPYEAGAQEAYAEMALAGTPQSLLDAQMGMKEIATGSPYQRAVAGDQFTEDMINQVSEYREERPEFAGVDTNFENISDVVRDPDTGEVTGNVLNRYMNPYQQTFVDGQKRMAREESARASNEIAQAATMAGGLGGYREGVMQSERERNLGTQLQDIQASGDMDNYLQAKQAFEADRMAREGAARFNREGLREQADVAMQGFNTIGTDVDRRTNAARGMADLTGTRQAMEYDRLGNIESAGSRRRGLAQQGLDIGYQDFLRQQAFPREQLNLYSGLLRGVPVGPGTMQATYGNQPSAFQQMVGSGIGAAGLYGATQGSAGGWGSGWGGS
jgi:hypothetical protein